MKPYLIFLMTFIISGMALGQSHNIPSEPILSNDQRAGFIHQSGGPHGQSTFVSFKLGLGFKGSAMNKFMIIK